MNAAELIKETYPTIEFEDKWDYLTQRFSADDMIYFAELYAQKQTNNLAKFCKQISQQKDCPSEFIDIVNKEFWNLI